MKIKAAICEVHPELAPGAQAWAELAARVKAAAPDIFLLNELPFGPWISAGAEPDPAVHEACRRAHLAGIGALGELGSAVVLGTRAVGDTNEAFIWTPHSGATGVHTKQYFPDEPGYYEARWFRPGERHFRVAQAGPARLGFLICTEVMFNEHARRFGRQGAQIVAVPRAVGAETLDRWLVAMRMAAIVSGCYVLSSNRGGADSRGQVFGGRGWIVDPWGDVVAETSPDHPVAFAELDLDRPPRAQREYPCTVPE